MAITALTHPFATASSSPRAVRFRSVAGRVPGVLVAVLVASVDVRAAMAATDPATVAPRHGPDVGHRDSDSCHRDGWAGQRTATART